MKFFTVNGYLCGAYRRVNKEGGESFLSIAFGKMEERYPRNAARTERAKTSFGPGSRDIKERRSREGEGKGPGSVVSPRCVSLAFDVGCCVLFEYPLESWLCRSFGLGRKALTSAFHSESTTGHVDHSLLRNTYLRASSSSLYRPSPSILSSPSTRLPSPFTSLFPLSRRLDSFR